MAVAVALQLAGDQLQRAPVGTQLAAFVDRGHSGGSTAVVVSAAVASDGTITFDPLTEHERYLAAKVTSRVDSLEVDGTSGTYTLAYLGEATAALAFDDDDEDDVQAALEGLTTIGVGNVTVVGGPGDNGATTPYVVTFTGALAGQNDPLEATDVDLAGGGAAVTVVNTTAGAKQDVIARFRAGDLAGPSSHPVARRASAVYNPGV